MKRIAMSEISKYPYALKNYAAVAALAGVVLLGGCASSSSERIGTSSNNQPEYRITCADEPFSHIKDCHDEAEELCPAGYTVVKEDEVGRGAMVSMWSLSTHELIAKCN